jgi:hypothetical protein
METPHESPPDESSLGRPEEAPSEVADEGGRDPSRPQDEPGRDDDADSGKATGNRRSAG